MTSPCDKPVQTEIHIGLVMNQKHEMNTKRANTTFLSKKNLQIINQVDFYITSNSFIYFH